MGLTGAIVRVFMLAVLMSVFTVLVKPFVEQYLRRPLGIHEYIIFFMAITAFAYFLTWALLRQREVVVLPGGGAYLDLHNFFDVGRRHEKTAYVVGIMFMLLIALFVAFQYTDTAQKVALAMSIFSSSLVLLALFGLYKRRRVV